MTKFTDWPLFADLLGKTLRLVVIAYAGYYTLARNTGTGLHDVTNMTLCDSLEFIGIVVAIAIFAWLVRSSIESEPDPLLLNLTFFAFAGQCVLSADLMGENKPIDLKLIWLLDLITFILVFIQVRIVMGHASTTIEHYERLLRDNKADENKIGQWAEILFRITGADFYPQFYQKWFKIRLLKNTPGRRRKQAISILPGELFKENNHKIDGEALLIEADERKWPWRIYAGVCVMAWILFIVCLVVGRNHQ